MNRRAFVAAAAALPFAVRDGRAFAGGWNVVLATADTESRVAVVDPATGDVVRSIRTLAAPRSVECVGWTRALVAHTALGAVTVIGPSLRVERVLRGFREPRYVAAHPGGRLAFVTDSALSEVVTVDVVQGLVLGRARVGGWARHVTIDAAGRTLWVGLGTASAEIAVVDVSAPARPRLVRRLHAPFGAHDVAFSGRRVWVTAGDGRELAVYDRRRGLRTRLAAGPPPQHVAFGERVAYVTSGADGTLRVHALDDGRLLRQVGVPPGSYNIARRWLHVVTPSLDAGTLTILRRGSTVPQRIEVASSCHDACFLLAA